MAKKNKLPEIGTKLYDVWENLYYVKGKAAPIMEYVVVEATVVDYYKGGFMEVCLLTDNVPNRGTTPYRHNVSNIGKKIFYTRREAAVLAKKMTEEYERTTAFFKDQPLRRTWAKYLED